MEARLDHLVGCAWFWVWALVGFGLALGAVSLGLLVNGPVALLALWLSSNETARRSAFGLLSGAGALCLLVAWLQQGGDSLDARPWLAIGLVLALSGLLGHARRGD
jgi:uncharacterized membrane protein